LELDTFLKGEVVELCIPTEDFSYNSDWYSWFNDPEITKYLDQGLIPNTKEKQRNYFLSLNDSRLLLIIKANRKYLGVVSLSSINLVKRTADIAIVLNSSKEPINSPIIALESMALLVEYAFEKLAINRIYAGQAIGLKKWQQRLELIGFRIEGITRNSFIKNRDISDSIIGSMIFEDYQAIKLKRGKIFDSAALMRDRFQRLPRISFTSQLENFFEIEAKNYYQKLLDL